MLKGKENENFFTRPSTMNEREVEITVDGVELTVRFESDTYDLEPYSWGCSRGTETEVNIYAVLSGGVDIMPLLSDGKIEEIEEKIRENL